MPKPRILIVEDELEYAQMVKMRLESAGYEALIATDAYLGTQKILQDHVDLVVLDLNMPMGGGRKVLERIRAIPDKADLPIVILTAAEVDAETTAFAEAHGVDVIFCKPYDPQDFLSTIGDILNADSA